MREIDNKFKFIENQREKYHFSMMPIISNLDDIHRSVFIKFATLSATIGAFSFLLFDTEREINFFSLVIGDILLLTVIIVSSILYIFFLRKDHKESLKSYRKTISFFDDANDGCLKVLKGELESQEYYKDQVIKLKNEIETDKKEEQFPSYFYHYIILIIFCYALVFIGISLINFYDLENFLSKFKI